MSSVISHIETDHRNKLCIVRLQPYSSRGRDMKKLAALQTLAFLLNSETAVDVKYCIHSNADANKDKELTNKLEVCLCGFCPSQNYSIVFFAVRIRDAPLFGIQHLYLPIGQRETLYFVIIKMSLLTEVKQSVANHRDLLYDQFMEIKERTKVKYCPGTIAYTT